MPKYTYFADLQIYLPKCEEVIRKILLILQEKNSFSNKYIGASILISCNRLSDSNEPNELSFEIGNPRKESGACARETLIHMGQSWIFMEKLPEESVGIMIELPKWKSACGNLKMTVVIHGLMLDENIAIAMKMLAIVSDCDIDTIHAHVKKNGSSDICMGKV